MPPALDFFGRRLRRAVARVRKDLPVELESTQPCGGIARFRVHVSAAHAAAGATIVVHAGRRRGDPIAIPRSGGRIPVGVQTHLLPDGQQRLMFELQMAGVPVQTASAEITVSNPGPIADQVRASLLRRGTSLSFGGDCDASLYPYDDPRTSAWFDRPDALAQIARREREGGLCAVDAALLRHFVEYGYVTLEGLLDDALLGAVNREIDQAIRDGYQDYVYGSSQRLEHLHLRAPNIRRLWLDQHHLRVVDLIFGVRARPCQTLTYVFGSQQDPHQDTIHLTPFPAGYMCGTWIALQDVTPDSGELVVYPGSHREPRVRMYESGCAKVRDGDWSEFGAKVVPHWARISELHPPLVYRPRRGTVLIWHENLLHGGSPRGNPNLERRSLVIHSFAEGAAVYYDSTGRVGSTIDPVAARTGTP
jgi:hypothetical protein